MAHEPIVPAGTPAGQTYSPGVVAVGGRTLYVSGQIAVGSDGVIPADPAEQCRLAWEGVARVVAAAGMTLDDVVKVTGFLTSAADIAVYRTARTAVMGGRKPASTLLIVAGLADPAWVVEVEAVVVG